MNKKWLPYIAILFMAITILVIQRWKTSPDPIPEPTVNTSRDPASNKTNRDKGFDRQTTLLKYSKHATCRMQCRRISQAEVEEIMQEGKINYNKSDLKNARCPRYAIEGTTRDDQRVRIVFAQCNENTTVVTVIDLETEWTCDCPGDDNKYKNRN